MATKTSIDSGSWSTTGVWGGSVPTSGDSVTITAGHSVVFDVDQSSWSTGLAALVINGSLALLISGGPYYLKMGANITGTGTFTAVGARAGTYNPRFTIDFTGGARYLYMTGGSAINFKGTPPTNPYCKMTATAAIGAATIAVDTAVSSAEWLNKTIRICNWQSGSSATTLTCTSLTTTSIGITPALTVSRALGSYVFLADRNITITNSTSYLIRGITSGILTNVLLNGSGTTNCLYGSIRSTFTSCLFDRGSTAIGSDTASKFYDNIFTGTGNITNGGVDTYISGGISAGCNQGIYYSYNNKIENLFFYGSGYANVYATNTTINDSTYYGCTWFSMGAPLVANNCNISVVAEGAYRSEMQLDSCVLSSWNTISHQGRITATNSTVVGTTSDYNGVWEGRNKQDHSFFDLITPNGVHQAWTSSGRAVSSIVAHPYLGELHQFISTNIDNEVWVDEAQSIAPGERATFTLYGKSSSAFITAPTAYLYKAGADPKRFGDESILAQTQLSYDTNYNIVSRNQYMLEDNTTDLYNAPTCIYTIQTSDVAPGFPTALSITSGTIQGACEITSFDQRIVVTSGSTYSVGMWVKNNRPFTLAISWQTIGYGACGDPVYVVADASSSWQYIKSEGFTAPPSSYYAYPIFYENIADPTVDTVKYCGFMFCSGSVAQPWVAEEDTLWKEDTLTYTNTESYSIPCKLRILADDPTGLSSYLWYKKQSSHNERMIL